MIGKLFFIYLFIALTRDGETGKKMLEKKLDR